MRMPYGQKYYLQSKEYVKYNASKYREIGECSAERTSFWVDREARLAKEKLVTIFLFVLFSLNIIHNGLSKLLNDKII